MKKVLSFFIACMMMCSIMTVAAAESKSEAEIMADNLKSLNLFQGTDKGYELDRPASRTEAMIMLIRLLGKGKEAEAQAYKHPFTDVPAWADAYIGYAYTTGLTSGISATEFGSSAETTPSMYYTFVLRALGYSDSKDVGDFTYADPFTLADSVGIASKSETAKITGKEDFLRGSVVAVSFSALDCYVKGGSIKEQDELSSKLIANGVFTREDYSKVEKPSDEKPIVADENKGNEGSEATDSSEKNSKAEVKTFEELEAALANENVTEIFISKAFEVKGDVTINKPVEIFCGEDNEDTIVVSGNLLVNSKFEIGVTYIENAGTITVGKNGKMGVYMTTLVNNGEVIVDDGGYIEMDRGGGFENNGTLTNNGTVNITSNGGNFKNNAEGAIENNGDFNAEGYFDNFGGAITGSSAINMKNL